MNNILELDLILNRKRYPKIYNANLIIIIIILIFIYIIFTYKYQSYYITKGRIINNELEISVNINDIKYIEENNLLVINNKIYSYKITHINKELFIDNNFNNYQYVYLKISNLNNIDNYIYQIKIEKDNKILAKYIKEYLQGGKIWN